ncbi:hypothetical protein [Halobacillus salinus]|uniref:DUF4367 domain-containing protein n=1 Tax=Halobacillus salinus TaxID=192814 RepID=A0A4Z0H5G1_9BACI|nr:hypothetical protein [Halobacillus salinus]TGB04425.1 hypothetical protein E4663_05365 [Halobacillus salinus]
MWKSIVLLGFVALSILLSGCAHHIDAESTFNDKEVAADLEELSIDVKLPTILPFEAYKLMSTAYPEGKAQSYSLNIFARPEDKEVLAITAVEGTLRVPLQAEEVELEVGEVGYYSEQGDVASVVWEDAGVSYQVQHICEENSKLFTKQGFITFINQFE